MARNSPLMDSSQVVSRSNSDLLAIEIIAANTNLSTVARMEAIAEYSREWFNTTRLRPSQRSIGTTEYERAKRNRKLFTN